MHVKKCPMRGAVGISGSHLIENVVAFHVHLLKGALLMRLIVSPENKATALLINHCQRPVTCKKPGTAFTTEYQIPGADDRTLV
eukprot:1889424-Amphidinium_carterae.1